MSLEKQAAPAFRLPGSDNKDHSLSDYAGKPLILYFYPKDNTSGCTTEACDFRDNMERLTTLGVPVLGVSRDSLKRHAGFIEKHSLNFVLLTDEEVKVHEAYEAWGEKKMYGKIVNGVIRSTFLIDAEGVVVKQWRNVRTKGHVDKVMAEVEKLF